MKNGWTLIELLVVLTIACILIAIGVSACVNMQNGGSGSVSFGINGMTEERCIGGFKHIVGAEGNARQLLNAEGGGIPCP